MVRGLRLAEWREPASVNKGTGERDPGACRMKDTIVELALVKRTERPMGGAKAIERGTVTISGRTIAAVGPAAAVDTRGAAKVIDATNCVVMPGFANCHTHIASNQLLRGLLEDVRIFEWLKAMWQLKTNFDE